MKYSPFSTIFLKNSSSLIMSLFFQLVNYPSKVSAISLISLSLNVSFSLHINVKKMMNHLFNYNSLWAMALYLLYKLLVIQWSMTLYLIIDYKLNLWLLSFIYDMISIHCLISDGIIPPYFTLNIKCHHQHQKIPS